MPAVVVRARVDGAGRPRPPAGAATASASAGATIFTVAVTRAAVLCMNPTERYSQDEQPRSGVSTVASSSQHRRSKRLSRLLPKVRRSPRAHACIRRWPAPVLRRAPAALSPRRPSPNSSTLSYYPPPAGGRRSAPRALLAAEMWLRAPPRKGGSQESFVVNAEEKKLGCPWWIYQ